ncbi:cbb3-type cytochrome c oxidase subunit 3 [Bdellovibrio sp. KM01]|uniref:cbb3-type cytochrome oxidase subunit 3 n=1 Tax=Bdellovibrio sp. KM01 TaxID=2748865 RepID=UPI0015EA74A9|nr:cbb3-type cytochrome c oxidase subunit 3 [Bdellovibrio sp. KM01]QLY24071.1 cbb3-type cytochrome c oxidase subunit 3 [Bdellovibrio sp. KM01]
MKQEGLKYFTDLHLTSIGLMIFFVFFICVLVWVFRKNSKHFYNEMQNMPLRDQEFTDARQ